MENLQIESFESGITKIFFSSRYELRMFFKRLICKLNYKHMMMLRDDKIWHNRSEKSLSFKTEDFKNIIEQYI